MKIDASPQKIVHSFSRFMHRYHVIIFTIFVLGGLSAATFLLYQVTALAFASPSSDQTTAAGFDKTTIDRISKLHGAGDAPTPLELPPGRTNPFQD